MSGAKALLTTIPETVDKKDLVDNVTEEVHQVTADITELVRGRDDDKQPGNPTKPSFGKINLFEDAEEAFMNSIGAYFMAEFRTIARNEELKNTLDDPTMLDRFLQLPVPGSVVITTLFENKEQLRKIGFKDETYHEVIEYLFEQYKIFFAENKTSTTPSPGTLSSSAMFASSMRRMSIVNAGAVAAADDGSSNNNNNQAEKELEPPVDALISVFGDEKPGEELVYGIVVNPIKKQLTVSFRGSVTSKDFGVDFQLYMTFIPNPVQGETTIPQATILGIHKGFYTYLNKHSTSTQSKFEEIVGHLKSLLAKYPGYSIYACGHSLGGALATLFTFQLAALNDDAIPLPITCISLASPRVGNIRFAHAFQELEVEQKIRHLRIANNKDFITKMPDGLNCLCFCCSEGIFRHAGMQLLLYPSAAKPPHYRINRPRVYRSRIHLWLRDLVSTCKRSADKAFCPVGVCVSNYRKQHSLGEYMRRLECVRGKLQELTLGDLYKDYREHMGNSPAWLQVGSEALQLESLSLSANPSSP